MDFAGGLANGLILGIVLVSAVWFGFPLVLGFLDPPKKYEESLKYRVNPYLYPSIWNGMEVFFDLGQSLLRFLLKGR